MPSAHETGDESPTPDGGNQHMFVDNRTRPKPPAVALWDDTDGEPRVYEDDGIAEVVTIPGGMVQAIALDGTRHDPVPGHIFVVTGDSWTVWVRGMDGVERHDGETHVQKNPQGAVVHTNDAGYSKRLGAEIRRAKRTELLQS